MTVQQRGFQPALSNLADMSRGRRLLAVAGVLALSVGVPASGAEQRCRTQAEPGLPVVAPVLFVQVTAERSAYRRGGLARLPVAVRVGSADGPKAAGAEVIIRLRAGAVGGVPAGEKVLATLVAQTDAAGNARPTLRLGRSLPTGPLEAEAEARSQLVGGYDCTGLVFGTGAVRVDPVFRLTG